MAGGSPARSHCIQDIAHLLPWLQMSETKQFYTSPKLMHKVKVNFTHVCTCIHVHG